MGADSLWVPPASVTLMSASARTKHSINSCSATTRPGTGHDIFRASEVKPCEGPWLSSSGLMTKVGGTGRTSPCATTKHAQDVLRVLLHRSQFREVDTNVEHIGRKFGRSGRLNHHFVPIIRRLRAKKTVGVLG
jgi:hypothetical protein